MNNYPRMHVSLYVSNIDKTVKFYTNFFNVEPVKVKSNYAKFILDSPSLIISFVENAERVQENFGHLGFQVETQEEMYKRLAVAEQLGLNTKKEIGTACCYALQDKFWVTDPDDVQWEVYYFHSDSEFNDPHFENEDAEACCMPPKTEKKKLSLSSLAKEKNCCEPGSGCC